MYICLKYPLFYILCYIKVVIRWKYPWSVSKNLFFFCFCCILLKVIIISSKSIDKKYQQKEIWNTIDSHLTINERISNSTDAVAQMIVSSGSDIKNKSKYSSCRFHLLIFYILKFASVSPFNFFEILFLFFIPHGMLQYAATSPSQYFIIDSTVKLKLRFVEYFLYYLITLA